VIAEIRLLPSDDISEFAALYGWLRTERALIGSVTAIRSAPADNELGGVYDLLAVALGSGGAGVALARSLTAWLQTRRSHIALTVSSPAGSATLNVDLAKSGDVLPVLQEIMKAHDDL
jgi:hypothetical protein